MKDILTVEEVAAELNVTDRTIRQAINEGKLKAHKKFGKWFILADDLKAFISSDD